MSRMRGKKVRKFDALTAPDVRAVENQIAHALAPFDRAARNAEHTWGIDKLPEFVSPDTASKYGYSVGKLNDAIRDNEPEAVAQWAAVCMRGLAAMDAEARAAGHQPGPDSFWMHEQNGDQIIIARDVRDWPLIEKLHPGVPIFSLTEVANALEAYGQTVTAIKREFPGAQIQPKHANKDAMNDPLPF